MKEWALVVASGGAAPAALEPLEGGALHWLAFVLLVSGGLVFYAGYAGNRRTLRPNAFIGIRTPLTLENEAAWHDVHERAGGWLMASGLVMPVLTVGLYSLSHGPTQLTLLVIGLSALMTLLIVGTVRASRAVREEGADSTRSPQSEDTSSA